jgi:hypothetical protein
MPAPKLLAMLSTQPPIEGDDALLRLAQSRLGAAGLGGSSTPGVPTIFSACSTTAPAS